MATTSHPDGRPACTFYAEVATHHASGQTGPSVTSLLATQDPARQLSRTASLVSVTRSRTAVLSPTERPSPSLEHTSWP